MKRQKPNLKHLGISLALTLTILCIDLAWTSGTSPQDLAARLGFPLLRLLGIICLGLFAGQVIETFGWTRQLAVVARPFFNFSNLGVHCSAAFTTAFISGTAANAMLLEFYEQKKISKLQLFLTNYVNQFPAFFLHLPTTMFVVLPLTGAAGALYFLLTFTATLCRTVLFFMFGKVYLKQPEALFLESAVLEPDANPDKPRFIDLIPNIKIHLPARMVNIAVWVLPIYTLVFILNSNGFFDYLNRVFTAYVSFHLIPVQSLSVVVLSFAAEFTSGFAAAGALMDAGVLTIKQTVIALLLGNILAFPIRALRHQIPRYVGIFSPKMGLELLLSGQMFRILSLIFIGILYYWVA